MAIDSEISTTKILLQSFFCIISSCFLQKNNDKTKRFVEVAAYNSDVADVFFTYMSQACDTFDRRDVTPL